MLTAEYNYQEDIAENRNEAYREGYSAGEVKGHAEGCTEAFAEMVRDGRLSVDDGARYSGMSLDEFYRMVHRK